MSQRKKQLNRQPSPPAIISVPRLTVIRPGYAVRCVICSPLLDGFHTHWDPKLKHSVECTKPTELCVGHSRKLPIRWKGCITVLFGHEKKPVLLDIPPETGLALETIQAKKSLRGVIVSFKREGSNIRSRLLVEEVDSHDHPDKLPPPIDPLPTLKKLWGIIE